MPLIPWQASLAIAAVAAGAIFVGGWKVESWRAAGALETEQLAHKSDVDHLKDEWQTKLDAADKIASQARADLDAERALNETARENAENAYQAAIAKQRAAAIRASADAQRVRDALDAAIAASRAAGGSGAMQQAGPPASCGGASGQSACGLLARAIGLAQRCVDMAGQQHAALVEAVSAWPKKSGNP